MIEFKSISNKLVIVALLINCAIFTIFGVREVYRVKYLYSYDPGYHLTTAEYTDAKTAFATEIETYQGGKLFLNYSSSMRLITVLIHQVSGIPYLDIYKLFGLFCRLLTVFAVYVTVNYLLKNRLAALLAGILFLSTTFTFYRAIITYPENLVLPFHILVFYDVVRAIRGKKTPFTLPLYFAASLMVHYRSAVAPVLLIGVLFIYKIIDYIKNWKKEPAAGRYKPLLKAVSLAAVFLFISLPVFLLFIKQYLNYFVGNIGSGASYASAVVGYASYAPPAIKDYMSDFGPVLFLIFVLSLPLLFYKISREKFILIAWLALTVIMSRAIEFELYVPAGRMMIYLIIPAVIASAYFLNFLMKKYYSQRLFLLGILMVSMIFFQIGTLTSVHGWVGIADEEVEICAWVNKNIAPDNSVIIFNGIRYWNAGFKLFPILETREDNLTEIFADNTINREYLNKAYSGKNIYLVISDQNVKNLYNFDLKKVFSVNGIKVYKI